MSYSAIANSEIDASSPLTETLMTKIRDNIKDHVHGVSDVVGIGNPLGAWVSRSFNTVYLAATDLLVIAYAQDDIETYTTLIGLTDANNPPTTPRIKAKVTNNFAYCSITFPVKKGDYWKVNKTYGYTEFSIYEIAIGT